MSDISPKKAYFLLTLLVTIWGTSWPINKVGLAYISPLWFSLLRLVVASLFMLGILLYKKKLSLPERQDIAVIFSVGFFQIGLFIICVNLGLMHIGAGRAAFLAYTFPFFLTPITVLFFGESFSWLKGIGLTLGFIGIFLLFPPEIFNLSDHKILIGNSYLLLAAISFGAPMLHVRYGASRREPLDLIFWQLLVASLFVAGVTLFVDPSPAIHWGKSLLFYLFYTGVLATGLGFLLLNMIGKKLPVMSTSFFLLGVPLLSLVASLLWLQESLSVIAIIGMALITAGLVCVFYNPKAKPVNKYYTD